MGDEQVLTLPPGCAYIITGSAQGRTEVCENRRVAHEARSSAVSLSLTLLLTPAPPPPQAYS